MQFDKDSTRRALHQQVSLLGRNIIHDHYDPVFFKIFSYSESLEKYHVQMKCGVPSS